jgi:hypothetical protein
MRLTIRAAHLLAALAASLAVGALPAAAASTESAGQMVVLKANQIGEIFCLSRLGNDEAVISGILTDGLSKAIADAEKKDDAYAKKYPDEEPPLGDGIPWQSAPDYAAKCEVGLVSLSKTDARVEIKYTFPDAPDANFSDTLTLKKIPIAGMDVGYWRIDDVLYPDGTDLKKALVEAFSTN